MKAKTKILNKEHSYTYKKITPARVAFLGIYLGIMLASKYFLGFIPGIELITFMFIIAGIFFPIKDASLLIVSFNFAMIALYGWGTWQIAYWVIWPFNVFSSKLISKLSRNIYVFTAWGFICGFLVAFWYFLLDLMLFGTSYAFLNIISAVPINLIEGITTSIVILVTGFGLPKIFAINSMRLWGHTKPFVFKGYVKTKWSYVFLISINVIFAAVIIFLFLNNDFFISLKNSLVDHSAAIKLS